jgi:thiol:disulfide interchange protein/DsbC/DsbD-like thiol-disulfide interchange protein
MKFNIQSIIGFITGILVLCTDPVAAAPVRPVNVEAELISEVASIRPGEPFWIALRQVIRPGWHTYWRNPGDSGAQTTLTWTLPDGFRASEIHWPYPSMIPYGPLMNFGYSNEVVFPVKITVPDTITATEVRLQAKGEWLVCSDICIPEDADLELVLPVSNEDPVTIDAHAGYFRAARQKLPVDIGVRAEYSVGAESISLSVLMSGLEQARIKSIIFFPYEEAVLDFPSPQKLSMTDDGFRLLLTPGYNFEREKSTLNGIIVVTEELDEELRSAFVVKPVRTDGMKGDEINLLLALVFAFLGGLILNLMPCVFPVLTIKILSLVENTHSDAGAMRTHGFVYVFGVVSSFVAIAVALIALRAGGEQIGWGFQLQSPIVVGLLIYLFVVIGLNLSGYFEFGLSMMGAGDSLAGRAGYSGSFFTGVLAAVVAAPCTAPFMGAAIGFALTQDAVTSLAIFASLGLGMALPYLLLTFSPALINRLPGPGPWMKTLKEVFAFPMFAAAVWLIWVLNQQNGADGLLAVLSGLLLIGFAIWLSRRPWAGFGRWLSKLTALVFVAAALGLTGVVPSTAAIEKVRETRVDDSSGLVSEPYSPARLKSLLAQGPVFVNFSAAWCITCKVNDLAALSSEKVRAVFEANNVSYLEADWTNEDPVITRALAEYGRSGVPLYLLYARDSSRASILPQILTESIVIEAIEGL